MLPPSYMFWMSSSLCSPPQPSLYNFARRSAHLSVPNLLASDQTTFDSLSDCLADEAPIECAGLDQVENRSQGASELEALRGLYVVLGQVGIMKDEDAGNIAVASEVRRNGHVELRRIQIRQVEKAERRLMAVYTINLLVPVPGPTVPTGQARASLRPETERAGRCRGAHESSSLPARDRGEYSRQIRPPWPAWW